MPPPQALFLWLALLGGFVAASSNANSSNATSSSYPPLPVTGASDLTPFSLATGTSHFVTARDGKLYLDDVEYTFSSFNAPDLIGGTQFEIEDTFRSLVAFGRPVTRTYTLGVVSVNVENSSAFIQGWDSGANGG